MKGRCGESKLELLVWLCDCLADHNKTEAARVPCRPICTIAVCLTTALPGPPYVRQVIAFIVHCSPNVPQCQKFPSSCIKSFIHAVTLTREHRGEGTQINRPVSEAIATAKSELRSRSAPPSRFRQDGSWQTRVRQQCELEVVCHFQMQVNQEDSTRVQFW